jgi:hypothetical protein
MCRHELRSKHNTFRGCALLHRIRAGHVAVWGRSPLRYVIGSKHALRSGFHRMQVRPMGSLKSSGFYGVSNDKHQQRQTATIIIVIIITMEPG